jgi:hypothetical protein
MRLSRLGGRALRLGRLKGRKKILYFFYFGKKFCTILMGGRGTKSPKNIYVFTSKKYAS